MKIAIISGSHRPESQSGRVAEYLSKQIKALRQGTETYVLDLGKNPLPFWDESMWGQEGVAKTAWEPISKELQSCDAAIVIAAEWNGTVPAALKNFFHFTSGQDLGHKAGLIVGISGSINGAYPISEMRSSSYKNCKICYMPDQLIIRHVGEILHEDERDGYGDQDSYTKERIDYTLNVLFEYAEALNKVRASEVIQNTPQKFAFGQ